MVTIKGKKISNKLARDSIKAMEKLIYFYKNPDELDTCPLCNFREGHDINPRNCSKCPWVVLKNNCCVYHCWFAYVVDCPTRTRNRIAQLKRWIKIYKKALES